MVAPLWSDSRTDWSEGRGKYMKSLTWPGSGGIKYRELSKSELGFGDLSCFSRSSFSVSRKEQSGHRESCYVTIGLGNPVVFRLAKGQHYGCDPFSTISSCSTLGKL